MRGALMSKPKLLLLDETGQVLAQRSRACAVLPGPPYPQLDLEGIWRWAVEALRELAAMVPIRCICRWRTGPPQS